MKKKLFAFLLTAVMVTALLPTMAFAGESVTSVDITIDTPEVGKPLATVFDAAADPSNSIKSSTKSVSWYRVPVNEYVPGSPNNSWSRISDPENAALPGYVYMPLFMIEEASGYGLSTDTAVTVNEMQLTYNAGGLKEETFSYHSDNPSYITVCGSAIELADNTQYLTKYWVIINTPQIGKTLDFEPQADFAPQGSITVPSVTWYKAAKNGNDEWVKVEEDEVAEEGYVYGARLEGELGENFAVAEDASIKVNDVVYTNGEAGGDNTYKVVEIEDLGTFLTMSAYFEPMSASDDTTPAADETTTAADGTNPKTGDNGNMFMWIALMAAGAAAAGVAVANRRKFSGR